MDDDDFEMIEEAIGSFDDAIAQRAIAFVHVAQFAAIVEDTTTKELCYTMLRKISASIKTPSTADLKTIDGGRL